MTYGNSGYSGLALFTSAIYCYKWLDCMSVAAEVVCQECTPEVQIQCDFKRYTIETSTDLTSTKLIVSYGYFTIITCVIFGVLNVFLWCDIIPGFPIQAVKAGV